MKNLTKGTLLLIFLLAVLTQLRLSYLMLLKNYWLRNDLRADFHSDMLVIGSVFEDDPLVTIAPYQDFVYFNQFPNSLRNAYINLPKDNYWQKIWHFLFEPYRKKWQFTDPPLSYKYQLDFAGNNLILKRRVESFSSFLSAIGQSVYYCFHCVVTNYEGKTVYYNKLDLASDNLYKARELGYRLEKTTDGAIFPADNLSILNIASGKQIYFSIESGSKAILHDDWRVLEIVKTEQNNTKVIENIQNINL